MRSAAGAASLAALVLLGAGAMERAAGAAAGDEASRGIPLGSAEPGEGQVVAVDGEVADILERFASADGALTTEETTDAQQFTLAADVYFAFGSAQLEPRAAADLGQVAGAVRESRTAALVVVGHTDAIGSDADNQVLSEARAQAVAGELGRQLPGIAISAEGRGETEPVAQETIGGQDNLAGRALNRRVTIAPA